MFEFIIKFTSIVKSYKYLNDTSIILADNKYISIYLNVNFVFFRF